MCCLNSFSVSAGAKVGFSWERSEPDSLARGGKCITHYDTFSKLQSVVGSSTG